MRRFAGAILAGLLASSAQAADFVAPGNICIPLQPAAILDIPSNVELEGQVVGMMNDAILVADDPDWIANSRPAFIWASEAKVACGKAYGYLRTSYRDPETLNKCECFYRRMQYFMN